MPTEHHIVLRFRDVTPDVRTIEEHLAVIREHGSVWWGWWRKEDIEPDGIEALTRASRSRANFEIGIVDRDTPAYYKATCAEVAFDNAGGRITAPAPQLCPEYYRAKDCGAWFRLTDISELNRREYETKFGPTPAGNPSLYVAKWENGKHVVLPKPGWNLERVPAPGAAILHLSDLHFGSFHGYPTSKVRPGSGVSEEMLDEILLRHLADEDIGLVVLSGDCISRGEVDAIVELEAFLERLADGLGLEPKHFVIVPGNHDFGVLSSDSATPTIDYWYERSFRRFMESYYGKPRLDLERIQRFTTADGWDLVFVALNSARLRGASREYGYVGLHRYDGMLSFVHKVLGSKPGMADKRIVVPVLHHHIVPVKQREMLPPVGPVSLTVDAGELLSVFQREGVQLVLHGHQHLPFVSRELRAMVHDRRLVLPDLDDAMWVVGMGSTGAGIDALSHELPHNTYGIYEPTPDGLRVRICAFNQASESHSYFDEVLRMRP